MSLILAVCQKKVGTHFLRENLRKSREPHKNLILRWRTLDCYATLLALEDLDRLPGRTLHRQYGVDVRFDVARTPIGEPAFQ